MTYGASGLRAVAEPGASGARGHAVDATVPSIARVHDHALGGKDNFAADRRAARRIARELPDAWALARDSRDFVRRAVQWMVGETGIEQLVDVGCGLPTADDVHEIARRSRPDVRVVYVDRDPIVLAHGRALLVRDRRTAAVHGDVRVPSSFLDHDDTRALIDLERPVGVLLSGVLHHLDDADDPAGAVDALTARLPAGSYVALANLVADPDEPRVPAIERAFLEGGLGSGRFRAPTEHRRYVDDLELVEPGLVPVNDWRPDLRTPRASPVHRLQLGAVGRVSRR